MYGDQRGNFGADRLSASDQEPIAKTGDQVETFAMGTIFATTRGPIAIEMLRVGDTIINEHGDVKTILWMREDRHAVVGADPAPIAQSPGRQTRFPGVRFVRGRRSDTAYQVIFGNAETLPISETAPSMPYVAEFSSSRSRNADDDTGMPLAAE